MIESYGEHCESFCDLQYDIAPVAHQVDEIEDKAAANGFLHREALLKCPGPIPVLSRTEAGVIEMQCQAACDPGIFSPSISTETEDVIGKHIRRQVEFALAEFFDFSTEDAGASA